MNKRIFALLLFLGTFGFAQGQVVFRFSTDTVGVSGETVDVDVIVESGFDELISMQFSLNWDRSVFTYSSIQNITTALESFGEGSIGTPPGAPGVDDGELTISWSGPGTQPRSLPDGTRLFTLRLFGEGALCSSTRVQTSDIPLKVEIFDKDFVEIDIQESGGVIAILDETCQNTGGDEVVLTIPDLNASSGSNICIPITADNFDNIGSLQTGITWDPSILTFTSLMDAGLTAITTNENRVGSGELTVSWLFDTGGVTLPAGATLFEVCFDVSGNTGQQTDVSLVGFPEIPFPIEVSEIDLGALDFRVDNGVFTVGSGSSEEGIGLIFPDVYTEGQPSICVPVTSKDFVELAAVQAGVSYDPAVLRYTEVRAGALRPLIGDGAASTGELRLLWSVDTGGDPVTVADGDVLFELCFEVLGSDGDVSELSFINIPGLAIEIVNEDGSAVDPFFVRDGSVTVGNNPNADVTLIASDHLADTGDTVCVDITVEGFSNINGMGFALEWDQTVVQYLGQQGFNLANFGNSSFNFESPNRLILSWSPTSSQTVADGTSIFQVCYNVIGNCGQDLRSAISFVDGPTPLEVVGNNNQALSVAVVNGAISIDTCKVPSVTILSLVHPSCNGDRDGAVAVSFSNTTGAVTCSWTDASGAVVSSACNLVGVGGGVYTLAATDDDGFVLNPRTVTVINPDLISITPVVTDITCNAPGSLGLTVTGGTGAYSYNWTGGLPDMNTHSPIGGGTYAVTVTDVNNCTAMASATVQNNAYDLDPIVTPVTGQNNGAIDLRPAASVDATYLWSTGGTGSSISGLAIGDYSVTITDDAPPCSAILSFSVTDGVLSVADVLQGINDVYNGFGVSCNGESDGGINGRITGGCTDGPLMVLVDGEEVTVDASGMIQVGDLAAGEHTIRVEDACGAIVDEPFTITEPMAITTSTITDFTCPLDADNNGSLILPAQGGVGMLTFTSGAGTVGTNGSITDLGLDPFTVVIEDDNGCQLMVPNISLRGLCGPNVAECIGSSIITPNGDNLNDRFQIGCVANNGNQPNQLSIYDRWGNPVYEADNYNNDWLGDHMDGTQLPEGGYMWVLITGGPGQREITRGTVSILR